MILALYRAARELFWAGAAILRAFARLLGVLVETLPHVMLAGIIALGVFGSSITSTIRCSCRLGFKPADKIRRKITNPASRPVSRVTPLKIKESAYTQSMREFRQTAKRLVDTRLTRGGFLNGRKPSKWAVGHA